MPATPEVVGAHLAAAGLRSRRAIRVTPNAQTVDFGPVSFVCLLAWHTILNRSRGEPHNLSGPPISLDPAHRLSGRYNEALNIGNEASEAEGLLQEHRWIAHRPGVV